jgi:NAD(P)H-hydrate repair Nnr-like enzyme with NAD(P)H-hydrate dehydratase domain
MLRQVSDAGDLEVILRDDRITALCLGPGLGTGDATRAMVATALAPRADGAAPRGVVLDADALTVFADAPGALFDRLHGGCVLTPHMGEFARLFPDLAERLQADPARGPAFSRIDAARAAAERAGCTLLLKGMDTVIASPGGECAVHLAARERAAPWLATAGAGDVLAGLIAGLIARGLAPPEAAEAAAWLHVEAGRAGGPGLVAEDLPELLVEVLRRALDAGAPEGVRGEIDR